MKSILPCGWIDHAAWEAIASKAAKVIVAVDGSEMSMVALSYVTEGLMQGDHEMFTEVFHVYDDAKDYLPVACRKKALMSTCDAIMIGSVSSHRYQLNWVAKRAPGSTNDQLCEAIRSLPADYACLGFHGLKGKKDYLTIMGGKLSTNVFSALNQGNNCSLICIKDEKSELMPLHGRKAIFAVSVNLSKSSVKAFLDSLRLSKPGDEVHLVYVTRRQAGYVWQAGERDYTAEVKAKFEGVIAYIQEGGDGIFSRYRDRVITFTCVAQEAEELAMAVARHADEVHADFLVVGANSADRVARGKRPIGSTSLHMCMLTDRNFIIAKWLDVSPQVYESTVMSSRRPSAASAS